MTSVTNINEVLDGHVSLEIDCVDRLLLNAYVPNLQVSGQVVTFLTDHLGYPIPSPALLEKIGNRFPREVKAFAGERGVPILTLKKPDRTRWDDRKLDHVRPYLDKAEADGRTGVVAIVQTQEYQWVFSAKNRSSTPGVVSFDFMKEDRRVGMYYFYVLDADFGPSFIKILHLLPLPGQGMAERPRVGQAPGASRRHLLRRALERLRLVRGPGRPPGHLRPPRACGHPGLLRPVELGDPDPVHR